MGDFEKVNASTQSEMPSVPLFWQMSESSWGVFPLHIRLYANLIICRRWRENLQNDFRNSFWIITLFVCLFIIIIIIIIILFIIIFFTFIII